MWNISRDKLVSKLQFINMIPETPGIPSSEFIRFRGSGSKVKITLSSYLSGETEIEGKGKWPIKEDVYIDRRALLPWIFASKEIRNKNPFVFTAHKTQLSIQHGSRSTRLDSQAKVKGYSNAKHVLNGHHQSSIPLTEDLKMMLSCGKNCAISDQMVPNLNCVYITKGKKSIGIEAYASSDRVYYLGSGTLKEGKVATAIPFPLMMINLLTVDGLQKLKWVGKYVVMTFKEGKIWQPVSQEALESFPVKTIQKHSLKSESLPVTFIASSRRFSKLITRLGYYLQSVRKQDWVATVSGKRSTQRIYIDSKIAGARFKEKLVTKRPVKKDFKLNWPLDTIQDVFAFLATKNKKLGVVVRIDQKHGLSYVRTGQFWLAVTAKHE